MSTDKGNEETLRFLSSADLPSRPIDISGTIDRLPSSSLSSTSKSTSLASSATSASSSFSSTTASSSSPASPLPSSTSFDPNDTTWSNCLCRTRHPIAAFFHICFKGTALLLYVFHSWLSATYVTSFVMIILLLAIDFWTVKNITGRLLVGLRWWNRLSEDGLTNEWIYESSPYYNQIPPLDRRLFWSTLYTTPCIFGFFFLTSFLSFSWDWSLISGIGIGLTGANLFGYIKCSKDAQQRLSSTFTGMGSTTLQFFSRTILPSSVSSGSSMLNTNGNNGTTNGIPNSVLSIAVNSALTSFLNVATNTGTTTNTSTANNNHASIMVNTPTTTNNTSNRHIATRNGPGDGMVTSNISDFDAVSDPFGDRILASSHHERVVI